MVELLEVRPRVALGVVPVEEQRARIARQGDDHVVPVAPRQVAEPLVVGPARPGLPPAPGHPCRRRPRSWGAAPRAPPPRRGPGRRSSRRDRSRPRRPRAARALVARRGARRAAVRAAFAASALRFRAGLPSAVRRGRTARAQAGPGLAHGLARPRAGRARSSRPRARHPRAPERLHRAARVRSRAPSGPRAFAPGSRRLSTASSGGRTWSLAQRCGRGATFDLPPEASRDCREPARDARRTPCAGHAPRPAPAVPRLGQPLVRFAAAVNVAHPTSPAPPGPRCPRCGGPAHGDRAALPGGIGAPARTLAEATASRMRSRPPTDPLVGARGGQLPGRPHARARRHGHGLPGRAPGHRQPGRHQVPARVDGRTARSWWPASTTRRAR